MKAYRTMIGGLVTKALVFTLATLLMAMPAMAVAEELLAISGVPTPSAFHALGTMQGNGQVHQLSDEELRTVEGGAMLVPINRWQLLGVFGFLFWSRDLSRNQWHMPGMGTGRG